MTRRLLGIQLLLLLVLIPTGCKPSASGVPQPQGNFTVNDDQKSPTLANIQVIRNSEPIRVYFALTNPTKDELVYAISARDSESLAFLQSNLYQDGKYIPPQVYYGRKAFDKKQIRHLKPKEVVILHYDLPFTELNPGSYELRLLYEIHDKSVHNTEFGLTAIKLEQVIFLDVRKE